MANLCLICGNPQSGKKYLLNKLIKDVTFKEINKNHRECTWNIANKYYESDVTLTIINSTDIISQIKLSQFSAIILVLNMNQSHSVIEQQLNEWFDILSPYLSVSECNLLIGNYVKSYLNTLNEESQKKFHKFLHEWSVDNCFEFVASPFASEHKLPLFASSDMNELSHYRIESALQCVMWPNMQRNVSSKKQNNKTRPLLLSQEENEQKKEKKDDDFENNQFRKGDKVRIDGLKSKPNWNGKIGEVVGHFSRTKKRWPVEIMIEDEEEPKKALLKAVNLCLLKEEEDNDDDDEEEKEKEFVENMLWNNTDFKDDGSQSLEHQMGSFQSLIDEMQSVRNEAKSGKLTDEERRKKAADTAMRLLSYMGLEDGDDEEENETE